MMLLDVLFSGLISMSLAAHWEDRTEVGMDFPRWRVKNQDGEAVTDETYLGKRVLLWWYPKAETPGCIAEGLRFKDLHEEFESLGVEVLGISSDPVDTIRRFKENRGFPYPLLSDPGQTIPQALQHTSRRWGVLIGKDRRIQQFWGDVSAAVFPDEVLEFIRAKGEL